MYSTMDSSQVVVPYTPPRVVSPNATVTLSPNRLPPLPGGVTVLPDGNLKLPEGSVKLASGPVLYPDGSVIMPLADGTYPLTDGSYLLPDNSISHGTLAVPMTMTRTTVLSSPAAAVARSFIRPDSTALALVPASATTVAYATGPGNTTLPNGMVQYPDGTIFLPSTGTTHRPDGTILLADGTISEARSDGSHALPNGTFYYPSDNSVLFPDGALLRMDGSVVLPDGSIITQEGWLAAPPRYAVSLQSASYAYKIDPALLALSQTQPDGTVRYPNGMVQLRDGRVRLPDGSIKYIDGRLQAANGVFKEALPDGRYRLGDGSTVRQDGGFQYPDKSVRLLDNIVIKPDGSQVHPDGTVRTKDNPIPSYEVPAFRFPPRVPVGSVPLPDGSYRMPNGCIQYYGGTIKLLNGYYRLPDGRVVQPNGASANYELDGSVKIQPDVDFLPDLNMRFRDGSVKQPDACMRMADGATILLPTGVTKPAPFSLPVFPMPEPTGNTDDDVKAKLPAASVLLYPGCFKLPNGALRLPDGTYCLSCMGNFPPGSIVNPDGSISLPDGSTILPDGKRIGGNDFEYYGNGLGMYLRMADDSKGKQQCVVVVDSVIPNGPAERAGILKDDIILAWNYDPLNSRDKLVQKLQGTKVGDTIWLTIWRPYPPPGRTFETPLIYGGKPGDKPGPPPKHPGLPCMGMYVGMVDDAFGNKANVVQVVEVVPGGPASKVNISKNDKILKWNDVALNSYESYATKVMNSRPGDYISIMTDRGPATVIVGEAQPPGPFESQTFAMLIKQSNDNKVIVHEVIPTGPADRAGIAQFDRIVGWNDESITTTDAFMAKLKSSKIGETVRLKVESQRIGSQQIVISPTIEGKEPVKPQPPPPPPMSPPRPISPPPPPPPKPKPKPAGKPWIGFAVREEPEKNTIYVKDVAPGGPAEAAGILDGDEITLFAGEFVPDMNAFRAAVKKHASQIGNIVTVNLSRDENGVDNALQLVKQIEVGAKPEKEVVTGLPPLNTFEDYQAVIKSAKLLDTVARAAWAEADADQSGFCKRNEFVPAMRRFLDRNVFGGFTDEDFLDIFDQCDRDRSGLLTKDEFPGLIQDIFYLVRPN